MRLAFENWREPDGGPMPRAIVATVTRLPFAEDGQESSAGVIVGLLV